MGKMSKKIKKQAQRNQTNKNRQERRVQELQNDGYRLIHGKKPIPVSREELKAYD